jgi:methylated-DNA-[protein]-cysteine S-methyltransferase
MTAAGPFRFAVAPPGPAGSAHLFSVAGGHAAVLMRGPVLCRVFLPTPDPIRLREALARSGAAPPPTSPGREAAAVIETVVRYFAGEPVDPAAVPLEFDPGAATPFSVEIYAALRRVKRGSVTTYGDLAAAAGRPGAARAVGSAMARNRFPLFVPCHRVLARGGALGGFSSPGGIDDKLRLLALEGFVGEGGRETKAVSSE